MGVVSHKSFRVFFETYFLSVYRLMLRYTGEREAALDCAQEAFARVYEHREEFETEENARAFVYTVARHVYLDHCKRERTREAYRARARQEVETGVEDFWKEVMRQEAFRVLYEAIDRLPGQTRAIILSCLKGNNNAEVAGELGISVNTVKSLKKSGYAALRKMLSRDLFMFLFILLEK